MLTLLALMLGPNGLNTAQAFTGDDDIYIGVEPTLLQHFHQERQDALRHGEGWQSFLSLESDAWQARFDERTGTPLRAWGDGLYVGPASDAHSVELGLLAFFGKHETLLGVSADELRLKSANYVEGTDTWYVDFDRLVDGVPVYRGGVTARLRGGLLVMFGAATHPAADIDAQPTLSAETALEESIALGPAPEAAHSVEGARLVVLPLLDEGELVYHLAWETRTRTATPPGIWVSHVDAHSGALLNVYNEVRFITGQLYAEHDDRHPGNGTITSPLPLGRVENDGGGTNADEQGVFTLTEDGRFSTELRGSYVTVNNQGGDDAYAEFSGSSFTWTTRDADIAEIDSYVFLHEVRDWGLTYAPDVSMVRSRLTSNVNLNQSCNAYYDGDVNFFVAGSGCNNTGRIADVNYHEWGHGFHYTSLEAGQFDGSISEGIGDVVSALMTGDSVIAPYFMTSGSGIRELATDRVYPDDWVGEVHTDGLIFAGAVWDLWEVLGEVYPEDEAYDLTVTLFANAIKAGPTIPESYDEFVLADDDDNDLSNGTPNQCQLLEAFQRHGLGPGGVSSLLYLGHETVENQLPTAADYPLSAELTNLAPECVESRVSSAKVHFSVDNGDSWEVADLDVAGNDVSGAIPAQEPGSKIEYYVETIDQNGDSTFNPTGGSINPHSFFVGELVELRCDDFDSDDGGYWSELLSGSNDEGANDWQHGNPNGAGGDPAFAYSGRRVWGNDLGDGNYNGEYQNDKHNRLNSAPFDVSEAGDAPLVLQFRRWLTIEDGYYDQAEVLVDGERVWGNHESNRNAGDEHHVDEQWSLHTELIEDADGDGEVTISWDLISDGGLTFGGWNIDDVCVYTVNFTPDLGEDDTGVPDGGLDIPGDGDVKLQAGCGCSGAPAPRSGLGWAGLALVLVGWMRRRR
ncbi:MAG: hypothetical protein H6740_01270 [Alphaproteobacteria bacterium]|nr:hypothetical protein [Alphaproteobacteria bacterium]